MNYKVEFIQAAKKQFEKLPKDVQSRIFKKIETLKHEPRPFGIEQLTDFELPDELFKKLYRVRIGDYRVIYAIEDQIITVTIIRIEHRSKVYRKK